jgi:hypothetical protein
MELKDKILLWAGTAITLVSLYQLVGLGLAEFYTLFSIGMSIALAAIYAKLSETALFPNWQTQHYLLFIVGLLAISVVIDRVGMSAGYWEYPHYDAIDTFRKYVFEWAVALFYHLLSLLIGIAAFKKIGLSQVQSFLLSILIVVTLIGFITESLNLQVQSWQIRKMPITNLKFGDYFFIFQTIGYWLMAVIPYTLYVFVGRAAASRRREES